jgi:3-hydroxy-9,10-secoandrosta-1,3,5(10)-triene-9,17-dione monooxygenase reductase component
MTAQEFRRVLGHLPTGVTVITAVGPEGPVGMAANSVTSVSLDPPLVLFCPSRTSETWPQLRDAGRFTINVMAHHHEDLTVRFAKKGVERFAGLDCIDGPTGPRLHDALAWIDCALRDEHSAGDHTIVVADVLEINSAPEEHLKPPLVFFRGRYGTFESVA